MKIRRSNFAKVAWLIVLCFGIALFSANNSQAIPLTVNNIIAKAPDGGTPYLTQYWLDTNLGELDAFCVEEVAANSNASYELIAVTSGLTTAAKIASIYYDGSLSTRVDNTTDITVAKVVTQLAIWDILGIINPKDIDDAYSQQVSDIVTLNFSSISVSQSVYLATSPSSIPGSNDRNSQDYLVSVPDASIMYLLGSALVGLGLFGRRRKSEF